MCAYETFVFLPSFLARTLPLNISQFFYLFLFCAILCNICAKITDMKRFRTFNGILLSDLWLVSVSTFISVLVYTFPLKFIFSHSIAHRKELTYTYRILCIVWFKVSVQISICFHYFFLMLAILRFRF